MVGGVNGGWAVAMTLLGYERGEAAATFPIAFRAELDRLVALAARARQRTTTRCIRQRLAWCYAKVEIMRFLGHADAHRRSSAARQPGPEASIFKLFWSEYHQVVDRAGRRHPRAPTRWSPTGPLAGVVVPDRRRRRAQRQRRRGSARSSTPGPGTIYAGTSQIQRNILGEMVLGLPKEPKVDPGTWREQQAGRS